MTTFSNFFFFFFFFDNLTIFVILPYGPWKSKFWKKWKKNKLGDIIILQIYTINNNHMIYGSWGIERNGQNFMSFQTIFCPFIFLTTQKIKILRKLKKNNSRYYHYTHVYHKWQSYDVRFLRYGAWQTEVFVILDIFCTFNQQNQNLQKMK